VKTWFQAFTFSILNVRRYGEERYADFKALGRLALRMGGKTVALGVVTETWAS
jgi:translation elongation factor EF-1alpha